MFCDRQRVGRFAVAARALAAGEPAALFRILVATSLFQRRQDLQVQRILTAISGRDVRALTNRAELVTLARASECAALHTVRALHEDCDLTKEAGKGTCSRNPAVACHLKRHTELLKRYGHFGKVPTSAALSLREDGGETLSGLYRRALTTAQDPRARALFLEAQISKIWWVHEKLAAMFLSAVTNRDLSLGLAPWAEGIDTTYFVVIDSNVDLFLAAILYRGPRSYAGRRAFIQRVAEEIDLSTLRPGLAPYNPRLVQQAMYLFMSRTNRRASMRDCSHRAPASCTACPRTLTTRCPLFRRSAKG